MRTQSVRKPFAFFLLIVIFSACNKLSETQFSYETIDTPASHPINDIQYVENIGFVACGGDRYHFGYWMYQKTGSNHWELDSITNKALYKIGFVNPEFGFLVGFDGRIHRTQDGGQSWSLYQYGSFQPFTDLSIVNDTVVFLTGGRSYSNGYIAHTLAGGVHWEGEHFESALYTIHFIDEKNGFAAGYGVLYKTTDGGKNWDLTDVQGDLFIDMYFINQQTGFLLGYQGKILKTTNGGQSWQTVLSGNKPFAKRINPESVHFYDLQHGMVAGRNGIVLYTNDGGSNWKRAEGLPNIDYKTVFMLSPNQAFVGGDYGTLLKVEKK